MKKHHEFLKITDKNFVKFSQIAKLKLCMFLWGRQSVLNDADGNLFPVFAASSRDSVLTNDQCLLFSSSAAYLFVDH